MQLAFTHPDTDGGSRVTGYSLMGDEGVFGSPFELLYDGTNRPELLTVNVTNLVTSLTYTFKLTAHNAIYQSVESSSIIVKIGLPPGQPSQPFDLY